MEPEETPQSHLRRALLLATPFLVSCNTQQVINVALSKDPKAAVRAMAENQAEVYKRDPQALVNDFNRIAAEVGRLFTVLKGESAKRWGKTEAETLPSPKRYVKYSEKYRNRVVVDYESNTVKVEHLDEADVVARLRSAIVVTLLTPEDPARWTFSPIATWPSMANPSSRTLCSTRNRSPCAPAPTWSATPSTWSAAGCSDAPSSWTSRAWELPSWSST